MPSSTSVAASIGVSIMPILVPPLTTPSFRRPTPTPHPIPAILVGISPDTPLPAIISISITISSSRIFSSPVVSIRVRVLGTVGMGRVRTGVMGTGRTLGFFLCEFAVLCTSITDSMSPRSNHFDCLTLQTALNGGRSWTHVFFPPSPLLSLFFALTLPLNPPLLLSLHLLHLPSHLRITHQTL